MMALCKMFQPATRRFNRQPLAVRHKATAYKFLLMKLLPSQTLDQSELPALDHNELPLLDHSEFPLLDFVSLLH